MKNLNTVIILLSVALIHQSAFTQTFGWRGEDRTGIYQEDNLLKRWPADGPALLWMNSDIGDGYSSATVTDETVFITGRNGDNDMLTALSLDGKVLWQKDYGKAWSRSYDGTRCTPTVVGNRIFLLSGGGDMVCLTIDGEIVWIENIFQKYRSSAPMFGLAESPLYVEGLIVASPGGSVASMVAFNAENGSVEWESESINEEPLYVSPKLINHNGRKIIVTNTNKHIIGVDAKDGRLLWKVNYDAESEITGRRVFKNHATTPIYHDGKIVISNGHKFIGMQLVLSEDGASVEIAWKNSEMNTHLGGVVLLDGYLYCSNFIHNSMGNWVCVDWVTGETMWSTEWYNKGSIISDGTMLYLYEEKTGHVGLLNPTPEKMEMISEFKIENDSGPHWAHPVISNGRLYIRHGEVLMVYNVQD